MGALRHSRPVNRFSLDSARVNRIIQAAMLAASETITAPELDNVSLNLSVSFQPDVPSPLRSEEAIAAAVMHRLSVVFARASEEAGGVLVTV